MRILEYLTSLTRKTRLLFVTLLAVTIIFAVSNSALAQTTETDQAPSVPSPASEVEQHYHKGRIQRVGTYTAQNGIEGKEYTVEFCCTANEQSRSITVQEPFDPLGGKDREFTEGERVVVLQSISMGDEQFVIADKYRLRSLLGLVAAFFALAIVLARKKAIAAIAGLGVSGIVLLFVIVPSLASGSNTFLVGGLGSLVIGVASILIAHGVHRRTILAVQGTVITILLTMAAAAFAIWLTQLTGKSSEDTYFVQSLFGDKVHLQGLLFVGIIIGVLGVLDDITTALATTIEEFHDANPSLTFQDLFRKGMNVGKEHIISLINTLVLAYAGASLPLLLLFTSPTQPLWVSLNSQFIAEEIVRSVIGSAALILAVPITTALAARSYAGLTQRHKK